MPRGLLTHIVCETLTGMRSQRPGPGGIVILTALVLAALALIPAGAPGATTATDFETRTHTLRLLNRDHGVSNRLNVGSGAGSGDPDDHCGSVQRGAIGLIFHSTMDH